MLSIKTKDIPKDQIDNCKWIQVLILTFWLCRILKISFSHIANLQLLHQNHVKHGFKNNFSIDSRFFCFLLVKFSEKDAPHSPKFNVNMPVWSPLQKSLKNPFQFLFILETISHKIAILTPLASLLNPRLWP